MKKQSTLKELCYEYSEDDLDLEPTEWHSADCLVRIFDEFAIGFMNWCIKNYHTEGIFTGILDDKELLEIYKKENNL